MKNECPNCNNFSFPLWMKVFAVWPFSVRCRNCKAAVRLKISRWQNVLVQILAQFVFWAALLFGINLGLRSAILGGILGAVGAIFVALIPGLYSRLEAKKKPGI